MRAVRWSVAECPRPGCDHTPPPFQFCCAKCLDLVPLSIRLALDFWAGNPHQIGKDEYAKAMTAAVQALRKTVIVSAKAKVRATAQKHAFRGRYK